MEKSQILGYYYIVLRSINPSKSAIVSGVLVTLVVVPPLMDPINPFKLLFLSIGSILTGLLLINSFAKAEKFRLNYISLILVISIALLTLISIVINNQKLTSALLGQWGRNNGLISILSFILLFFVMTYCNLKDSRQLLIVFNYIGFISVTYAWLQNQNLDILRNLAESYKPNGIILTVGNSNFASVLLGLTFTAGLGVLLNQEFSKVFRFLSLISVLLHLPLVPLLDTQGRILFAVGGGFITGFFLLNNSRTVIRKLSYIYWPLFFSIGVLGISGLFGFGIFANRLSDDLTNLKDRYYHWIAAINMLKDNYLFGVGIDSFGDYYRLYRLQDAILLRGTPMTGTDNAHNIFLQYGATGGIFLMLAYIVLIIFVLWRSLVAFKLQKDKLLVGTLFSIWIAYQVQSVISIEQLGLAVWNWLIGGALVSLSYNKNQLANQVQSANYSDKENKLFLEKTSILFLSSTLILTLFTTTSSIINDRQIKSQFEILNKVQNPNESKAIAGDLLSLALRSDYPKLRMIVADNLAQIGFFEESFTIADQTTRDFPNFLSGWEIAASILEANNQKNQAVPYRLKTVELDPLNEIFKQRLMENKLE